MKIENVLVSGNSGFLYRHQNLFKAMKLYYKNVDCLNTGDLHLVKALDLSSKAYYKFLEALYPQGSSSFWKNSETFIKRSKNTEIKIKKGGYKPDLVFHLFCMFNPFWRNFDIPYVIYADYTMLLANKNWSKWSPFYNKKELDDWIECEKIAYNKARHIFTMGNTVVTSLCKDYGVPIEKVTAVGSSGNCQIYKGEKKFGSKQILFNGSDFERKGGEIVLDAFKKLKTANPKVKLVIIGKKLRVHEDGIENPGRISSLSEMQELFLKSDLVVAPAYCDPFPTFVMEAMNYGVPCIVSARDGMPEIVNNGLDGIVIDKPEPELLAREVESLLYDIPRLTSMSQNARYKIKTQLNWNAIAKKIYQVLSTIN